MSLPLPGVSYSLVAHMKEVLVHVVLPFLPLGKCELGPVADKVVYKNIVAFCLTVSEEVGEYPAMHKEGVLYMMSMISERSRK